ncbi:MAG: hypothetical protein IPL96_04065 [Holophagaceae bacterium]|nr:hypothetical protein [Holophagaceae bacterium]
MLEADQARQDDELVRIDRSPASAVTITVVGTGQQIKPIGEVVYRSEVGSNYLTICFSDRWDELLFDDFQGSDACLVIHDVEAFSERFHAAVDLVLSNWVGIDGPVAYGGPSSLGPVFSKPFPFVVQHEWRFAWRPFQSIQEIEPVYISMGSISSIAEIIERPHHGSART